MTKIRTIAEIRSNRPYYFVSIKGCIDFESDSITECKNYLCKYVKEHKKEIEENDDAYDYYIGMYSITIE